MFSFGTTRAAPTALGGGVEAVAGAADAAAGYGKGDQASAFQSKLESAKKEFAAMQRIEAELKQDEAKFHQEVGGYQQHLERASKRLTVLVATKEADVTGR